MFEQVKAKSFKDLVNDKELNVKFEEIHDASFLNKVVSIDDKNTATIRDLYIAFELIKNDEHWKNPIDAIINADDYKVCNAACVHFTCGYLDIYESNDGLLKVQSEGYYINCPEY